MNEPRKGLGRGLNALLGEAVRPESSGDARRDSIRDVEIARIRPNPAQPRQHFDEDSLAELAESIRRHGVLQPVLLRASGDGFELIAGERRWRAAQRAGLHHIPALVRDGDDSSSAELALIENVQREDLNAIEEAEGYQALIARFGHGQDEVAKLVGKSRSHVANLLRLLALPDDSPLNARARRYQYGPCAGSIDRAGTGGPGPRNRRQGPQRAPGRSSSPRRSGRAPAATSPAPRRATQRPADADLAALERQLGDMLGLKVQVQHKGKGGTVSLRYSSLDQLDMICQRLSGEPI